MLMATGLSPRRAVSPACRGGPCRTALNVLRTGLDQTVTSSATTIKATSWMTRMVQ
ncbi:hypothetical protein DPMN_003912 [Dreissena polymorpha]|uniref:Uncharacterized protein n=1 Tax=Dreissena polymorpha TaxID=45954 RepID=A0A9D4MPS9_DREPO|nr:hypothetical protein DPMN_003912 [Dreissena polymorpha]